MATSPQRRKNGLAFNDAAAEPTSATGVATASLKKRAVLICLVMACVTIAFIPIAKDSWPSIPAFLSAYHTVLIIAYFISAYIIYGFYQAEHSLSLLYLCCGCIYTATMQVLQFLSFPDLFLEQGTLFGGTQTLILLWCYWHAGLSAAILLYTISEWLWPRFTVNHINRVANLFWALLFLLIAASIASVTVFHDRMPILEMNGDFSHLNSFGITALIQTVSATAFFLLWYSTRFRSVLHVWLAVALVAMLFDTAITMIGGQFLSIGWYIGRVNAVISACVILLVYLVEINRVYLKTVKQAHQLATFNTMLTYRVDQARMDHLTGLPGRELFIERIAESHASSIGNGTVVAVLFIDLDGFKKVNDTLGHKHGDQVLVQTADILRTVLRDTDIAARLGGDEFVVCLFAPYSAVQSIMLDIASRIVAMVSEIGDEIGCSIGISLSGADNLNIESALRHADQAMYDAKRSGKNKFVIYGQPLQGKVHGFRKAIANIF
jgi:diguanylate cyclase (GGDEF)-like protein